MNKYAGRIIIGYLVIGALFALLAGGSLNPFRLATWGNVLLWLPLILISYFVKIIILFIAVAFIIWVLSLFIPQVKEYIARGWRSVRP
jgi:hypothetical protein